MNGDEKEEAQRPRPLSGGIWTLFHWLRRAERSSSSESLSSVGSARTAASFDFLSPGNYSFTNPPVVLTPLSPPTDSYKKRLQDRNLRRQRDRDITLHRKYGLFRGYGAGYDGFSLPPARRALTSTVDRQNRDRRATSECLQRRAAYVPGKRRAPLPPALTTSASLPRSYKRKRQAPKPPIQIIQQNIQKQNNPPVRMNSKSGCDERLPDNDSLKSSKTEKVDKKATHSKDTKLKSEKSFLKQIFENRKRNSAIETTSVRLLPSISELDKQAAEIIENNKLRQNRNSVNDVVSHTPSTSRYEGNMWFCTSCLRKYNASVEACIYCQFHITQDEKSISTNAHKTSRKYDVASSSQPNIDEQKMLKEILKEMKNSLPKRNKNVLITETPTLRIGSTPHAIIATPSSSKDIKATTSSNGLSSQKELKKIIQSPTPNSIFPIKRIIPKTEEKLDTKHNSNSDKEIPITKKLTDCLEISVTRHGTSLAFKNNVQSSLSSQISIKTKDPVSSSKDVPSHVMSSIPLQSNLKNNTNENKPINNENSNRVRKGENTKKLYNIQTPCTSSELRPDFNKDQVNSDAKIKQNPQSVLKPEVTSLFVKVGSTGNSTEEIKSNMNAEASSKLISDKKIETPKNSNDFPVSASSNTASCLSPVTTPDILKSSFLRSNLPSSSSDQNNASSTKNILSSSSQLQSKGAHMKSFQSSIVTFQTETSLHTPLKISSLLNPLYSPRISNLQENKIIESKQLPTKELLLQSDCNAKSKTGKNNVDKKENIEKLTKNEERLDVASTVADIIKANNNDGIIQKARNAETKTLINKDLIKDEQTENNGEKSQRILKEPHVLPSTSKGFNNVQTNAKNTDNLDHYNRRRHLINQLEQSIVRGDETAAAEAAAKLAKLRLSCSVLSFSSQIVAECLKLNDANTSLDTQNHTHQLPTCIQSNIKNQSVITEDTEVKDRKGGNVINNTTQLTEIKEEKESTEYLGNRIQSSSTQTTPEDIVSIEVWIEDKQAARGPIRLRVPRRATMRDLRRQAERSLGLDSRLQRWIVGRNLCTDDAASILSLAGSDLSAPFYLCLVQSETNNKQENEIKIDNKTEENTNQSGAFYTELIKLEQQALVPNIEPFECEVCMEECTPGGGVVLRECIHTFCRDCLSDVVRHCEEPAVSCPATGCSGFLQEREIRSLMSPEDYDRWLARSLATAESGTRNAFHCRTRDCAGWAFCEPGVRRFPCPVCKCTNCVPCQAIHEGETCEQYQEKLRNAVTAAETNQADEGTQALINSLLSRGEALECPECHAIITKKWGCDWVKCSACKTEICWVTKGRRWGPGGRGDMTGGCRCGVEGKRCHPSCGYCH